MLAALYNIPVTPTDWGYFTYNNQDSHIRINDILRDSGLSPPYYLLDPVSEQDFERWLWRHQEVHNYMNAALHIAGNDLQDVNLKDKNQLASWIQLHFSEHQLAESRLGIG